MVKGVCVGGTLHTHCFQSAAFFTLLPAGPKSVLAAENSSCWRTPLALLQRSDPVVCRWLCETAMHRLMWRSCASSHAWALQAVAAFSLAFCKDPQACSCHMMPIKVMSTCSAHRTAPAVAVLPPNLAALVLFALEQMPCCAAAHCLLGEGNINK